MNISYRRLLDRIGHTFADETLLEQALTHRSYSSVNNERLEFLGDAVLGMLVSQILYERFKGASEGDLSQLRACLVRGEALAGLASEMDLGEHLRLGGGELKSGGARRQSILANAVEAIIGAIFLDAGIEACRDRVLQWFASRLENLSVSALNRDAKTRLQEYLQQFGRELPIYEVVDISGEAHVRLFNVRCGLIDAPEHATGQAASRKKAEQIAAASVLEQLLNSGQPSKRPILTVKATLEDND